MSQNQKSRSQVVGHLQIFLYLAIISLLSSAYSLAFFLRFVYLWLQDKCSSFAFLHMCFIYLHITASSNSLRLCVCVCVCVCVHVRVRECICIPFPQVPQHVSSSLTDSFLNQSQALEENYQECLG